LTAECQRVAKVVDLSNDLPKRVSGFSGGMKRRLSLAIALLGQPQLLILDEPTVRIDPALCLEIWRELDRMKKDGCGVL
ncbi:ATP-binding cassette domain-containing protein, partial [Bacteroides cellulosilyticus]|uniref:ATP-binding cassette domain-containing protein n=1 Tax=Bacteroides cellulosilyticus TaxID=246787 RepID=UPI00210E1CFC